MKGRWTTAMRALLVLAVAAAAVIVANVALLGVVVNENEPVGRLRPFAALTAPVPEPAAPAETAPETATAPPATVDDHGGGGGTVTGAGGSGGSGHDADD
jgi:hypothetical protein